jgi:hypothetical protein
MLRMTASIGGGIPVDLQTASPESTNTTSNCSCEPCSTRRGDALS